MFGASPVNVAPPQSGSLDFLTRRAMDNMAYSPESMNTQQPSNAVPLEVQLHHLERVRLFQEMMRQQQQKPMHIHSDPLTHTRVSSLPVSASSPLLAPHTPMLVGGSPIPMQTLSSAPYPTPILHPNAMRRASLQQPNLPPLLPVYHRPIPNYAFPKKLRHRRKGNELSRDFMCFVEGCDKAYASDSALNNHLLTKHNIKRTRANGAYVQSCDSTPGTTPETTPVLERRSINGNQTLTSTITGSPQLHAHSNPATAASSRTCTPTNDDVSRVLAELSLMSKSTESSISKNCATGNPILRTYSPDVNTYHYGAPQFSPNFERKMAARQRSNSLPPCHNLFSALASVAEENSLEYSLPSNGRNARSAEDMEAWLLGLVNTSADEFMNDDSLGSVDADALLRLQLELMMTDEENYALGNHN